MAWYTVWRKVGDDFYNFYMAAENCTVAVSSAPDADARITKTPFMTNFKRATGADLDKYERVYWAMPTKGKA